MKTTYIPRFLILSALMIFVQQAAVFSQEIISAADFNPKDGDDSGKLLSTYKEFFKWKEYELAQDSWWAVFNEYPEVSEKLYVDGVTMYRHFIEEAPEGQSLTGKVDTLMLIYDQRMAYFEGEGNVLGRKGSDLLKYRNDDIKQVEAAYGMLKKSLELEGDKSRAPVMLNYISASLMLEHAAVIDKSQVMENYFLVNGLLDQMGGESSRWRRTRASIDEMILKDDILSCAGLDLYFGTRFDQDSRDTDLLRQMIKYYTSAGCKQSDLYAAASENLHELAPGAQSAHNLALLFISRNDLEKADFYLKLAVAGKDIPNETLAEWFYELSIISLAREDACEAVSFAREAISNKDDYGKAYIALGDAFIASRKQLGDDFQQRTAYWAASDMYRAALRFDPTLGEESAEKLEICAAQFPDKEDIFFQDLEIGSSYMVRGCIQANTTVRSRD
jgi:hypothetical protein